MRRPQLAGLLFVFACAAGACNSAMAPTVPTPRSQPAAVRPALAPDTLSLRGPIESVSAHGFIMLAGARGRVRVGIGDGAVVHGTPRAGAFAQTVGEGINPIHARYVSIWNGVPPHVAMQGTLERSTALGFMLALGKRSTVVVLWSRTRLPSPLLAGEVVRVDGSGSPARGIVAGSVTLIATPQPSPSPSPVPTPTPVQTPTPLPTPTPTPAPTPKPIYLSPGEVVGADDQFSPPDGDTPEGGQSQNVDGIPCAPSMSENQYHVHVYLGILVNGRQVAIPDQIGLYQPGPIVNGYTNTATCYYYIHTHDASGIVHIESFVSAPLSSSLYTLKNVLDVWGITVGPNNVGPFAGGVRTYVATVPLGTTVASNYAQYAGDPNAIALYSHEAIWLEVGAPYAAPPYLPVVHFYTEY
ncbi:MAG: hypothetical protein JOY98_02745 [Candidatus Eremiobacteraeota bacterium]|nr:hypothetical protein [Candidatus Eremiobacteraeota bacterium]